ncbi:MAG: hypothetical protein EBQ89_03435 [Alphaproteobacteria bacterium]|nr:hypothetical protein [Alphaproteobacteria bacterium]
MEMDINDWGLQDESFGFGNEKYKTPCPTYKQLAQSNTQFLNFFGDKRKQKKELDALREDYYKRIDALSPTDEAGRNALFSELEQKLKEKGASFDEINETKKAQRKAERGEKIKSGLSGALDIFTKTTSALGIGRDIEGRTKSSTQTTSYTPSSKKTPIWVWVGGGVVVLGLVGFLVYKLSKK